MSQLQLTAPTASPPDTIPADLKPAEVRWAWWAHSGPRFYRADGSWSRPVKQIGWVRGPAFRGADPKTAAALRALSFAFRGQPMRDGTPRGLNEG